MLKGTMGEKLPGNSVASATHYSEACGAFTSLGHWILVYAHPSGVVHDKIGYKL
jgi:hypothetical protein